MYPKTQGPSLFIQAPTVQSPAWCGGHVIQYGIAADCIALVGCTFELGPYSYEGAHSCGKSGRLALIYGSYIEVPNPKS